MTAEDREDADEAVLVSCHDCGQVHRVPELPDMTTAVCVRCGGVLRRRRPRSIERALALNLSALALFAMASLLPLLTLKLGGQVVATTLVGGVAALHESGMAALAALVLLVAVLFPLLRLLGSIWVLALAQAGRLSRARSPVFRVVEALRPWAMTEVYLLGLIVAWVKLRDLATVEIRPGLVALVALIVVMSWAQSALDPQAVWERVQPQLRARPSGDPPQQGHLVCHVCRQLIPGGGDGSAHARCGRCGAALHERKPQSVARAWALLLAAAILYVPANLLPIMTVISLGKGHPDTILSGVKALIGAGMWPVALLVFFASITVPVLKMAGLVYLLVSAQRGSRRLLRDRTLMYRLIEGVGRWSMVDIFMIAILVALVSLGNLAAIQPGPGAAAFAAVVVLTMLASEAFDPRLIWDAQGEPR